MPRIIAIENIIKSHVWSNANAVVGLLPSLMFVIFVVMQLEIEINGQLRKSHPFSIARI